MFQEPPNAQDIVAADKLVRIALVEAEAREALIARGSLATNLFLPTLVAELAAVATGAEGDAVMRVYGIDKKTGEIRNGPRGPMSARDALDAILREHPDYLKFFSK